MRFANRAAASVALVLLLAFAPVGADTLSLFHEQRYSMGTMFDVLVYHASQGEAEQAIDRALAEVVRLDQVLSHYKADSDLARLQRDGARGFVSVDRSLYDVIDESLLFSRLSRGRFDVTIGPLVKAWRDGEGQRPSASALANAGRCVGFEKIETNAPDRIRLAADCMQLDLGGIGKGYAVDRALSVLAAHGIQHALVNAGGSSIGAFGRPPGKRDWAVSVGAGQVLPLGNASLSTSEQSGETLDPRTGLPAETAMTLCVVMRRGSTADALSTTLLLMSVAEGKQLLTYFPDAAVAWIDGDGRVRDTYGRMPLQPSSSR